MLHRVVNQCYSLKRRLRAIMQAPIIPALFFNFDVTILVSLLTRFSECFLIELRMGSMINPSVSARD